MLRWRREQYEHWEIKFLAYMKLRKLKKVILPNEDILGDNANNTNNDADNNEQAFTELIQFIDETSLGLVIRAARDNGSKALAILWEHYAGNGKPRIISLYTKLTSLHKKNTETVTEYIISAETTATALKSVGEIVSDGLLIAMVIKGLLSSYNPFVVVTTQNEKVLTFSQFKVASRSYEENEKSKPIPNSEVESMSNSIMKLHIGRNNNNKAKGYRNNNNNDNNNNNNNKWCNNCRLSSHMDRTCRRKQETWKDHANHARDDYFTQEDENHTFLFCM